MIGFRTVPAVALAALIAATALAHDRDRPDLNAWFDHLASGKGLCCSFADGYAVADVDWQSSAGRFRVRIPQAAGSNDLVWVDVPDDAVITEPNRAGRTMVWPVYWGEAPAVRCFMPGSMT